ncbi:winged helix-turn-helix domain-containing protein [Aliivibrio fischeri]|uniref:winged helix-turn-helix domain-containing protein n=1 Tax=Aliivibrio fischeri TaxID=668 RepID=UPI0007C4B4B8|nr:winged helix-turn-helix domain-containing protein [Aliivibrio fischeri]
MNLKFKNSLLMLEDRPKILINNKSYVITIPESKILKLLIENKNTSITKNDLIVTAWGHPDFIGPNSLAVAISNIRKIIEHDGLILKNIPKVGYKLIIDEPLKHQNRTVNINNRERALDNVTLAKNSAIITKLTSSPIQILIFSTLTYFVLYLIHSWVLIN